MSGWVSKRDVTRQRGVEAPKKKLPGKGRDGVEGVNSGTPTRRATLCKPTTARDGAGIKRRQCECNKKNQEARTAQSKGVRPGLERKSNLRDVGV